MAHYAFLNAETNVVTEVIVGNDEQTGDWETYYSDLRGQPCLRTSYNANIRKNFAGVGFTYHADLDAFIPPKPYESWLLDEATCLWQAPIEYPAEDGDYMWDEETVSWVEVTEPGEA